jgi:hypothetical protein
MHVLSGNLALIECFIHGAAGKALCCDVHSAGVLGTLPHPNQSCRSTFRVVSCSLALLPAGAQQHVPAAVQHLMDSSSPIYDMYASCEGCEAAAQEAYVAQRAYDVSGFVVHHVRDLGYQV